MSQAKPSSNNETPVALEDGYYWVTLTPAATPQVVQVVTGTAWGPTPSTNRRPFVMVVGWVDRILLDKFLADHPESRWSERLVPSEAGPGITPNTRHAD